MLLLKQDITRQGQMETAIELDENNNKEYKVKAICDNEVYVKESDNSYHLSDLYYLVLRKNYPEEENTWEPILAI